MKMQGWDQLGTGNRSRDVVLYLVGDGEGQTETGRGGLGGVGADCMKGAG